MCDADLLSVDALTHLSWIRSLGNHTFIVRSGPLQPGMIQWTVRPKQNTTDISLPTGTMQHITGEKAGAISGILLILFEGKSFARSILFVVHLVERVIMKYDKWSDRHGGAVRWWPLRLRLRESHSVGRRQT
jgi:hypothetical protein